MSRSLPFEAQPAPSREVLLDALHALEWSALTPAMCETLRLLESGKFERLTDADIHEVANYRAIDLAESAFQKRS